LIDTTDNGGTSPFSSATETASLFVRPLTPVKTTSTFQEGVDSGAGVYTGPKDLQLRQNAAGTPSPIGSDPGGLLVDWADNNNAQHVLLRFDNIFGDGPGQIPLGSKVLSARLEITVGNPGDGGPLHRMLRSWNENTETWNSLVGGLDADGLEAATAYNAAVSKRHLGSMPPFALICHFTPLASGNVCTTI
jgi:hypothetical protein